MSCFMLTESNDLSLDVLDVLLFSLSMIAGTTLAYQPHKRPYLSYSGHFFGDLNTVELA
jgi:hypothetical protein